MKFFKRTAAVLALSAAMLSGPVQAVPVTVVGTTVSFTFDSALQQDRRRPRARRHFPQPALPAGAARD